MGTQTIMNAYMVLVIANGEKKAQAVHDMCFGPIQPSCPASILQLHPNCVVIADGGALPVQVSASRASIACLGLRSYAGALLCAVGFPRDKKRDPVRTGPRT